VTSAVVLVAKCARADLDGEKQRSPVVQTETGVVVGKIETLPHGKSVHEYLGIPYAEPPIGQLRFAAPKPVKPWLGTKDATEFGASCPQPFFPISKGTEDIVKAAEVIMSEDCLFLNIFVPSTIKADEKMDVMVWIHGGGFAYGTSTWYPGGVLAAFNDVIVVSVNYRLGILGFFNIPGTDVKGNYGILDQALALKWVQANIASFGGDPNRVTIFGESAGGMSVSLHLISPLSKGLFHRAIMQSGASSSPIYSGKVANTKHLELFAKLVNCSMDSTLVECVRGKAVKDILRVQRTFTLDNHETRSTQDFTAPIVDGELVPDLPENLFKTGKFHADVDVIAGLTSNEGALFALIRPPVQLKDGLEPNDFETIVKSQMLYAREKSEIIEDLIVFEYTNHADPGNKIALRQSMMEAFGDSVFDAPIMREAKALAKGGRPPYVYVFDHHTVYSVLPSWIGVVHAMDVPFVFGAPFKNIPEPFTNSHTRKYSEIEKGFSLYVMKLWTDFAKYGTPTPPNSDPASVTWPTYTEQEQAYLVLDLKPRVERSYKAKKMAFWNEIVPRVTGLLKSDENEEDESAPKDEL